MKRYDERRTWPLPSRRNTLPKVDCPTNLLEKSTWRRTASMVKRRNGPGGQKTAAVDEARNDIRKDKRRSDGWVPLTYEMVQIDYTTTARLHNSESKVPGPRKAVHADHASPARLRRAGTAPLEPLGRLARAPPNERRRNAFPLASATPRSTGSPPFPPATSRMRGEARPRTPGALRAIPKGEASAKAGPGAAEAKGCGNCRAGKVLG
jgi:hypothetical protein